MKTFLILCTMAVACTAGAESVAPPVSVDSADIITIVQRSLPFVKEKGLQWIEDRKCASCHQVPSMLWSLNSAARAGLETDQTPLAEWTQWATDWTHWNKSGAKDGIDKVSAANVDTMVFLMLARDANADKDAAWVEPFRMQLLKNQQPDGSWKACGQLPTGKRPERETTEVTTMWTLLALYSYPWDGSNTDKAKKQADDFLASALPGKSTEWHAVRLLLDPVDQSRRGSLLALQHADGSWGWRADEAGDAFGTGLALYALARATLASEHAAAQRAVAFLKSTQKADGSWAVPSTRANDKNKIAATSTFWGTAWAAIGLLEWQLAGSHQASGR